MYTLEVIPITKGLPEDSFTYFSTKAISLGALVEIKIRNRKVFGIVKNSLPLEKNKIAVKALKFSLKKIDKILLADFLTEQLFLSLQDISYLNNIPLSNILRNYCPNFLFENLEVLEKSSPLSKNLKPKTSLPKMLIENTQERRKEYLAILKERQQQANSVVIFFPTILDLEFFKKDLRETDFVYFHSEQTKKELKINLDDLKSSSKLLILSTPSLFPILLKEKLNLSTIILDQENSSNYINTFQKVSLDFREIIKKVSQDLNLELIFGGHLISLNNFLHTELISKPREKSNFKLLDLAKKPETTIKLGDQSPTKEALKKYNKVYFSEDLAQELENLKKTKAKAFLFTKRRGLATETICLDCNQVLTCEKCHTPYILFKKNQQAVYLCPNCKNTLELSLKENLTCQYCGSWRMQTLGIGSEGVEKELQKLGFPTFLLDSQNIKTKKNIEKTLEAWQKTDGSILLGTELALNFLHPGLACEVAAIISLDALFSIPDYLMDEKIFNLCLTLADKINTQQAILVQTRLIDNPLWDFIVNDNRLDFLKTELANRKMLNLPPYSKILKFQLNSKTPNIQEKFSEILKKIFQEEKIEQVNLTWSTDLKNKKYTGTLIIPIEFWQKEKDGKIIPSQLTKKVTTLLSNFKA